MIREKKDLKMIGNRIGVVLLTIMTVMSLTACAAPFAEENSQPTAAPTPKRADTGFVIAGPDSYDSADTAILVGRDEKENTLTFLNLDLGRKYTLSLDGTTRLYDKYGESISVEQVELGDIVDVTFLKTKKHLTTLQLSARAWSYADAEHYEINAVRGEISIGSDTYKITSNTQFLSEGRAIEVMDISASDVLSFQGIGSQVLTVRVEKGHGYLRLANDENFVGGWIEIGESQIQRITEDMLLVVPEGSYQVNISNNGGGGIKSVIINRNEETVLDIGDLEIPEPLTGMVLFSLSPSTAELYIDGTKTDASAPVTLEYGLHQLIVRAEGYQSITKYIRVAQESAGIDVVLDAVGNEEEDSSQASSSTADTATGYYKVYVDAPEGAEIYVDGNYVGISPCSFKKVSGSHIVILRRTGYETRSYTVQIDNEDKDISYSFAELVQSAPASSEEDEEQQSSEE